eukprot:Lankesteria_metandrocarpae@DN3819_c0_g1_i1.p1
MLWLDVTARFERECASMTVGQMVSVDGHPPKSGIAAVELGSEHLDIGAKPHERLTVSRASAKGFFSNIEGLILIQIMDELFRRTFLVIERILDPWLALYPCVLLCHPPFLTRNPLLLEFVESLWLLLKQCDNLVRTKLGAASNDYIHYVDEGEVPQHVYRPYRLSNPVPGEQDPLITLSEALHTKTSFVELGKDFAFFTSEERAGIACRLELLAACRSFFCAVRLRADAQEPSQWGRNLFLHADRVVETASRCKSKDGDEYEKYFSRTFVTSYGSPYARHVCDLRSRISVPDCFCKLVGMCLRFVLLTPMLALGGFGFHLVYWRTLLSHSVQDTCNATIRAFSLQCMDVYNMLRLPTSSNVRLIPGSRYYSLPREFSSMLGVTAKVSLLYSLFDRRESEERPVPKHREQILRSALFDCFVHTIDFAAAVLALDVFHIDCKGDTERCNARAQLQQMCYHGARVWKQFDGVDHKTITLAKDNTILQVLRHISPALTPAINDMFSLQSAIFWIMHQHASVQADLLSTLWSIYGQMAIQLENVPIQDSDFGLLCDPDSEGCFLRSGHLQYLHPLVRWLYRAAGPPVLCYFDLLHLLGLVDNTWDAVAPLLLEARAHDAVTAIDANSDFKIAIWTNRGIQEDIGGQCASSRLLTDLALVASAACDSSPLSEKMARSRTDFIAWKRLYIDLLMRLPGFFCGKLRSATCGGPWLTFHLPVTTHSAYDTLVDMAPYSHTLERNDNIELEDLVKSLIAKSSYLRTAADSLYRSASAAGLVATVFSEQGTDEVHALQSLHCALMQWGSTELRRLANIGELNAAELQMNSKAKKGVQFGREFSLEGSSVWK